MLLVTHSLKDISKRWSCKTEKVSYFIESGQLIAINVASNPKGRKPRWRITQEALDNFERMRSTVPAPKPIPRQRRRANETMIPKYFS